MKDFEILNRASGFLVYSGRGQGNRQKDTSKTSNSTSSDSSAGGNGSASARGGKGFSPYPLPKVHLLTASHVVAPWRWPKYYPEDWLQHVNEKHTTYTAELRHEDGVFATQCELRPVSYHHKTRDLALLHFENEDEVIELLESVGLDILELSPPPPASPRLLEGESLEFHGHHIRGTDLASASPPNQVEAVSDLRKSVPNTSKGVVKGRSERQIFAQTFPVLTQGMCGGPVIFRKNTGSLQCVGLVEGIVPADHAVAALQSLAVFVETQELHEFIEAVEDGVIEPLVGGHSIAVVSQDKDESKMNLQSLVDRAEEQTQAQANQAHDSSPATNTASSNSNFRRP